MPLEINLRWDPTGRWAGQIDPPAGELILTHDGATAMRFILDDTSPTQFGWFRHLDDQHDRVSVGDVLSYCFADWDADQAVLKMSRGLADEAYRRGVPWRSAARRLAGQAANANGLRRVPTLPFRTWWEHCTDPSAVGIRTITASDAARRAGYRMKDGRADTSRFQRRLGIRPESGTDPCDARPLSNRVNYDTAVRLCRALGRDPVELGL